MGQIIFRIQTYDIIICGTWAEDNPLVAAIHCFSDNNEKKRLVFGFCREGSVFPENSMKTENGIVVFRRYVHEARYAWVLDILRCHTVVDACCLETAPFAHGFIVRPISVGLG